MQRSRASFAPFNVPDKSFPVTLEHSKKATVDGKSPRIWAKPTPLSGRIKVIFPLVLFGTAKSASSSRNKSFLADQPGGPRCLCSSSPLALRSGNMDNDGELVVLLCRKNAVCETFTWRILLVVSVLVNCN